ncbi:MAG: glutathione peroxidase [Bacteroidales bacterium]|jgi:glutathione peroxidase|nr:glutathione peroxidase [Bacteroidales bacterium]
MKNVVLILILAMISSVSFSQNKSFYDFKVQTIDGEKFDLSTLKGKKVLVVNTASKCGFTPQYEDLQKLYEKYKSENFIILGFPANNFMNQEPGSNREIMQFCSENYGVTFPMMSKISVKGDDIHPIYQWLTQKDQNGVMDSKVKWNFQKYLIDESGNLVDMASPRTNPLDDQIVSWIEGK